MDFNETIRRLNEAQGNPEKLLLVTVDMLVEPGSELHTALEAAAVPHWFDAKILAAILDTDEQQAGLLLKQLTKLPMVETYASRNGWNVHEATRLAMRNHLHAADPSQLKALSSRAAEYYRDDDHISRIEKLYHCLTAVPDEAADDLEKLYYEWGDAGRHEYLQTLAIALKELINFQLLEAQARAQSLLRYALIQGGSISLTEKEKLAKEALSLFTTLNHNMGLIDTHDLLGDVYSNEGNLQKALGEFKCWQVIVQKLIVSDPENLRWKKELSVSHNKVGQIFQAQGNLADALKEYTASKNIRTQLTQRDPENTDWQRGLSVSHNYIGRIFETQGNLAEALKEYTASKNIISKLSQRDPENTTWQRDLSASHGLIGRIFQTQGNLADALKEYTAFKNIMTQLTQRDPDNTDWQRDLSVSHNCVGRIFETQGNLADALKEYTASKNIMTLLTQRDPENTSWQRDLSVFHNNIGTILQAQGNLADALKEYTASKNIITQLTQRDPDNTDWQRELSISHLNVGYLYESKKELQMAFKEYQLARTILDKLTLLVPTHALWQEDLKNTQECINRIQQLWQQQKSDRDSYLVH